jgi:hypothetical protein
MLLASGAGQYNSIVRQWCWPVLLACGAGQYCVPSPFAAQIWFRKWLLFEGRSALAIAKTIIINSAIIIITICIFAPYEHQERISADVCLQMFNSVQTAQIHPLTNAQISSQMLRSVQMLRSMCVGCVSVCGCECVLCVLWVWVCVLLV